MVLSESVNLSDSEKDWVEDKVRSAVNELAAKTGPVFNTEWEVIWIIM